MIYMYGNDHKGLIPPMLSTNASGDLVSVVSFGPGVQLQSMGLLVPPPVGWGQGSAYLTSPEVLFCPADEFFRPFRQPLASNPNLLGWGTAPWNRSAPRFMSYYYMYVVDQPGPNQIYHAAGLDRYRFGKDTANRAIMMDQGYLPPFEQDFPFVHKGGWNVLYMDGHALFVQRSSVEAAILSTSGDYYVRLLTELDKQ
jgi:prepilin-type processing-associated H-X9-DG protein